jgi:hypothetical protein
MEHSAERIKKLIEDASYLIDEAEALRFVIDTIPMHERPPGGESFYDLIASIEHAQKKYFRPFIQGLVNHGDELVPPVSYKTESGFQTDATGKDDAVSLLSRISKNRAGLLAFLEKVTNEEIKRGWVIQGKSYSIAELLDEMVHFERHQLKKAAEMVLTMEKPGRSD